MATDEKYLDNLLQSLMDIDQKQSDGSEENGESIVSANTASEDTASEDTASDNMVSKDVALGTASLYKTEDRGMITPEALADMVDRLDEILLEQSADMATADNSIVNSAYKEIPLTSDGAEKILSEQDLDSLFEEMDAQFDSYHSDGSEAKKHEPDEGQGETEPSDLMSAEGPNSEEGANKASDINLDEAELMASGSDITEEDQSELPQADNGYAERLEVTELFGESADMMPELPEGIADIMPELPEEITDIMPELPEESPDILAELLAGMPEETDGQDDLRQLLGDEELPSSVDPDIELPSFDMEEMDIGELLGGMGEDEDLSEIKGLLDKAENNELVDDDMMSLLDGSATYGKKAEPEDNDDLLALLNGEKADEENGKRKKGKKKPRKGKKRADAEPPEQDSPDDSMLIDYDELIPDKDTKKSFFKKFFAMLTDADEDHEPINIGEELSMISDENQEILQELDKEDKKSEKAKKAKKAKKDKGKGKGKDAKSDSDLDDIPEKGSRPGRGGEEEEAKEAGKKKPKKEKVKKAKEPEIPLKKEKKVSKKKVLLVFAFSFTVMAAIIATSRFVPDSNERARARRAYLDEDYRAVYDLLYGKNLSRNDSLLFNQSHVILQMERSLDAYQNYTSIGMPAEALHALFQGVARYEELRAGDVYGAEAEVAAIHQEIQDILLTKYNVSGEEVMTILSYDDAAYSHQVYLIALGIDYWEIDETETTAETAWPEEPQDLLPEEEEFY